MHTRQPATATSVINSAKRRATVTIGLNSRTAALRSLAAGQHPLAEARKVRDRYARSIGAQPGAGGDALLAVLMSPEAAGLSIEDIDGAMLWPVAPALLDNLAARRPAP